ncbi:hypothetical protein DPMN_178576 [Dreissena polymorpha]|uniref:Uncharacterized protein n=1 Tax=Dreissena polymorpha TaxID=45954 RepID=A0A9D4ILB9_DREPO|nr:hypothetical protein DPMN_178576 [Dreissena polymorpha]
MDKGVTTEEKKETEQTKETEEKTKPEEIREAARQSGIPVMVHGHKEDPFIFCTKDDPIWPPIK